MVIHPMALSKQTLWSLPVPWGAPTVKYHCWVKDTLKLQSMGILNVNFFWVNGDLQ